MGALAQLIGATVGGFLMISIISFLVEKFAFRKLPPDTRAALTVGVGWLITAAIAGWGMADGGPFVWTAGLWYLPGAILVWLMFRNRLRKAWLADEDAEAFE